MNDTTEGAGAQTPAPPAVARENEHHVFVEQTIRWRYTVKLPAGVSSLDQREQARQVARARWEAGERPIPKLVKERTSWDFASEPPR